MNVPDWERIGDAAKRVKLAGITENEAQLPLCRAILNRQIRVRIYLGKFERGDFYLHQTMWGEVGLIIPPHLAPRDFDWSLSSPLSPWRDFREGISGIFRNWRQDRIDVFCADVTKVLCGRKQAKGVNAGPSGRRGPDNIARRGTSANAKGQRTKTYEAQKEDCIAKTSGRPRGAWRTRIRASAGDAIRSFEEIPGRWIFES